LPAISAAFGDLIVDQLHVFFHCNHCNFLLLFPSS
jgi:hypothetical protein